MKKTLFAICTITSLLFIASCEKDEGKLPNISFKTGGNYISTDSTLTKGSNIVIGINASKAEDKDVLKKFNISKSVNGGANVSLLDKDLSGNDGDNYSYDFNTTLDTAAGQKSKYIFTVTNRDGITNQVSLTVKNK